jgi:TP901 family phage tail tape measure protein
MSSIRSAEKEATKIFAKAPEQLNKSVAASQKLQAILKDSFDVELGVINIGKFNSSLQASGMTMKTLHSDFSTMGKAGKKAFNDLTYETLSVNKGIKQTSLALEKMSNTFFNTIRWGISASIVQGFTSEVNKAFTYVKELDTSLNDIRIVTNKSAEEMEKFAVHANRAAKALGATTKEYSDAALIFYQQGLGDIESQEMARLTVMTSNVTGQDTEAVSEQLTSIRNGYKLTTDEMERYMDVTALIAAETAADLEEMATAMSKVSSAANMMGVEYDQLNAILATVVSVTRQAPENVGTAFKTIFARLGDLKSAGVAIDESGFEVKLGQISSQLNEMGVSILDTNGDMREMGDIITEVGSKWDNWTQAQKLAAAQAMAGKRQYNNLVALFENWDMYSEQIDNAANSLGTLNNQNAIYMQSTEAHLEKLKASQERVFSALIDSDNINDTVDAVDKLVVGFANFIESLGGGIGLLTKFGAIALWAFGPALANNITKAINSFKMMRREAALAAEQQKLIYQYSQVDWTQNQTGGYQSSVARDLVKVAEQAAPLLRVMTEEQRAQLQLIYDQTKALSEQKDALNARATEQKELYNLALGSKLPQVTQDKETGRLESTISEPELRKQITNLGVMQKQSEMAGKNLDSLFEKLGSGSIKVDDLRAALKEAQRQLTSAGEAAALAGQDTSEYTKSIEELDAHLKGLKGRVTTDQIKAIRSSVINAGGEAFENADYAERSVASLRKMTQEVGMTNEKFEELAVNINKSSSASEVFFSTLKTQQLVQNITNLISGIGQLGFGFQSLTSLVDVWNNESLSGGEQLLQTVTNLSMALPMLYNGFKTVAESLSGVNNALKLAIMATQTMTTMENALTVTHMKESGATVKQISLTLQKMGVSRAERVALLSSKAAEDSLTASKVAGTAANKTLLTSTLALMASNPVGWILGIVAAIGAVIAATVAWAKAEEEKRNQIIANSKATQEELSQLQTLKSEYDSLYKKYQEGTASKQELWEISKKIDDAFLDESIRVKALTGDWEGYTQALKDANATKLAEAKAAADTGYMAAMENAKVKNWWKGGSVTYQMPEMTSAPPGYENLITDYNENAADTFNLKLGRTEEEQFEAYQQLQQLLTDIATDPTMKKWAEENADAVLELQKQSAELGENFAEVDEFMMTRMSIIKQEYENLHLDSGMITSEKELDTEINNISKQFQEAGRSAAQAEIEARSFVMQTREIDPNVAITYSIKYQIENNESGEGFSKEGFQRFLTKMQRDFGLSEDEVIELAVKLGLDPTLDNPQIIDETITQYMEDADFRAEADIDIEIEEIKIANKEFEIFQTNMENILKGETPDEEWIIKYGDALEGLTEGTYEYMAVASDLGVQEARLNLQRAESAYSLEKSAENYEILQQAKLNYLQAEANRANVAVEAQNALNTAQENYNKALEDFGEDSVQAKFAAEQLAQAKQAMMEVSIAATIEEQGFSTAVATAAAAILAQDEAAKKASLESLRAEIVKTVGTYDSLTTSAIKSAIGITAASDAGARYAMAKARLPEDARAEYDALEQQISTLEAALANIDIPTSIKVGADLPASKSSTGSKSSGKSLADTLPALEDVYDRYWEINRELKILENQLTAISAIQDKLTGRALQDNLRTQITLYQKQTDALKRLRAEQIKERDEIKKGLAAKGMTFNAAGDIANFKTKHDALYKAANDIRLKYEKAPSEALATQYETAKEAYEEFLSLVERYEELKYEAIFNTEQEIANMQATITEANIRKLEIELEVNIDAAEAIRSWNEFEAVVLEGKDLDDPLVKMQTALESLSTYWNGSTGTLDTLSRQIAETQAEIAKIEAGASSAIYLGEKDVALSQAKEYLQSLMDSFIDGSLEYQQIVDSIKDSTLEWIDATADGFEELNSQFAFVTSELEHQANLIKLIYGEDAYDQMEGYYAAQKANNSASMRALNSQIAALTAQRDALGQPGDENFDQDLYDRFTAQIQNFKGELNSAIEESLELLADEYSNSISKILSDFAKGLSGGLGLPEIEKEWKYINDEAELYLDRTSATFKITKLQSQYMDAINKADSTQVKQHLNEVMNRELALLREKDELTQGDLERATKRLDIELKRVALEEAQRNKSTMKLQRDAQGNYSYVYTADESKISAATEDLRAAEEDFYEFNREALKKNKDEFLNLFKEYQEALTEPGADVEAITTRFQRQFDAVLGENSEILDSIKSIYAEMYGLDSEEYQAAVGGLDDVVQTMISNLVGAGGFGEASGDLIAQIMDAFSIYQEGISGVGEDSGRSFDNINSSIEEVIAFTDELLEKNTELIDKMWEEADVLNATTEAWREYTAAIGDAIAVANVAIGGASGTYTSGGGTASAPSSTTGGTSMPSTSRSDTGGSLPGIVLPGGSDNDTPPGDVSDGKPERALSIMRSLDPYPYVWGGDDPSDGGFDCSGYAWYVVKNAGLYNGSRFTSASISASGGLEAGNGRRVTIGVKRGDPGHVGIGVDGEWWHSSSGGVQRTSDIAQFPLRFHPVGYDTGGYTGDWGVGDGKLAFLHQKEIVLNEQDTSNLLLAVSAVRDLVGKIKTNTMLSQQDALFRTGIMPNIGAPAAAAGTSQQIQINADFPSVKDAEEIKKAFNNLINSAAQYANRKK